MPILLIVIFIFNWLHSAESSESLEKKLTAKIVVPYEHSLIRGEVPVYGLAHGKNFSHYQLEYTHKENPNKWELITKNSAEQKDFSRMFDLDHSLDKTIPGNLALWETGLTEYEYQTKAINLPMGDYLLKLTVYDHDQKFQSHTVPVSIGRVILNSQPGTISTHDQKARLIFKEHSLPTPAIVFCLKTLNNLNVPSPEGYKRLTPFYEINPCSQKFITPVLFEIELPEINSTDIRHSSIFYYDSKNARWQSITSFHNQQKIFCHLTKTPDDFALYAVFKNPIHHSSVTKQKEQNHSTVLNNQFIVNTFEKDQEQWSNKHGAFGAQLSIKKRNGQGHCLNLTNPQSPSSFAAKVNDKPFDVRIYQNISFEYCFPDHLKINMLIKINGQWFELYLTDDEKIDWKINIQKIGQLKSIVANHQWHSVEFNLYDYLKPFTSDFMIEEIVFADWDSTGYRKLELGNNKPKTSFSIDNFKIYSNQFFMNIGFKNDSSSDLPLTSKNFMAQPFNIPKNNQTQFFFLKLNFFKKFNDNVKKSLNVFFNQEPAQFYKSLDAQTLMFMINKQRNGHQKISINCPPNHLSIMDDIEFLPVPTPPLWINFKDHSTIENFYLIQRHDKLITIPFHNKKISKDLKFVLKMGSDVKKHAYTYFRPFELMINDELARKWIYDGQEKTVHFIIPHENLEKGMNSISMSFKETLPQYNLKEIQLYGEA